MKNFSKVTLLENEIPTHFLNINFYLKKYLGKLPDPALHPATKKPLEAKDLEALFPQELIKQEMSLEEKIEIPDQVRELYKLYRPTPFFRAKRLEKYLKTPAHIYYKYEGVSPAGSHKFNTALVQAYYNKIEGIKRLTTETGAGQWGSALAIACNFFGLECQVFMVKKSFEQKPYRKVLMELFGAKVFASPSKQTKSGKSFLAKDPQTSGSLGMAISEAIEVAASDPKTHYALGSVLNHVLLHQTIVGQEAKLQMEKLGEYPDLLIGCVGGGSNFSGFAIPFLADKISGKKNFRAIGVEAIACPKMTKGQYRYDSADTAGLTPLLKMETLGKDFMPPPIHAGGLRYHGNAPILSFLNKEGITEAKAVDQLSVFKAAQIFAKCEGLVVAPESAHAIKAVIDESLICREKGGKKVIVFNLSGHGFLDLGGYEDFLKGRLA